MQPRNAETALRPWVGTSALRVTSPLLVAVLLALALAPALAQTPPHPHLTIQRPELLTLSCPERRSRGEESGGSPESADQDRPLNPEEEVARARRLAYRALLPEYLARLPAEPDTVLLMPVDGITVRQVADTYGALRGGGRDHQGQDIFAPKGTPVRSATTGVVYEISDRFTGGRGVMVLGPGGVRYFYTHLDAYAADLAEGMPVTAESVIGYVGDDGNANGTPPHLHFGAYYFDVLECRHRAFNPLPLMVDREQLANER